MRSAGRPVSPGPYGGYVLKRLRRPGAFEVPLSWLAVAVFAAGLLFAGAIRELFPPQIERTTAPVTLSSASSRIVPTAVRRSEATPSPVRVDVDATHAATPNPEILRRISAAIAPHASGAAASPATPAGDRDAVKWARLDTDAVKVTRSDQEHPEKLDVYAVHSASGATVCMANASSDAATVQLRVRLAKAPYRLNVSRTYPQPPRHEVRHPENRARQTFNSSEGWQLRRLQGRGLANPWTESIPFAVRPGETILLRFTISAYASRCGLNEVREELRKMPRGSGELARRLHVILDGTPAIALYPHLPAFQRIGAEATSTNSCSFSARPIRSTETFRSRTACEPRQATNFAQLWTSWRNRWRM